MFKISRCAECGDIPMYGTVYLDDERMVFEIYCYGDGIDIHDYANSQSILIAIIRWNFRQWKLRQRARYDR